MNKLEKLLRVQKRKHSAPFSLHYLVLANFKPSPELFKFVVSNDNGITNCLDPEIFLIGKHTGETIPVYLNREFSEKGKKVFKKLSSIDSKLFHFIDDFELIRPILEDERNAMRKILQALSKNNIPDWEKFENYQVVNFLYKQMQIHFNEFAETNFNSRLSNCSYCDKFFYYKNNIDNKNKYCSNYCKKSMANHRYKYELESILDYLDIYN